MLFNIIGADKELIKGAEELGRYCGFSLSDDGFKIITEKIDEGLCVEFDSAEFRLFYSTKTEFYFGLSYCFQSFGRKNGKIERKKNARIGLMKNCVGNATPKIETLKKLIKVMALSGYDYLVLSSEDLFDVESIAYLGSFKYKITKDAIKEIDEYAKLFGIELIPGIQTLCPMVGLRSRDAFVDVITYGDTLLVDNDKTYEFIEKMIKFCSENFSSKRIHLGMELSKNLAKGKYFKVNGHVEDLSVVFAEHVKNTNIIAQKYGFKPSIWADNLLYTCLGIDSKNDYLSVENKNKDICKMFPSSIEWGVRTYPKYRKENYKKTVEILDEQGINHYLAVDLCVNVGFSPLNLVAQKISDDLIELSKKDKIKDLLFILSDENGAECSCFSALSSIIYVSEKFYGGEVDTISLDNRMESIFQTSFSTFNLLDIHALLNDKNYKATNPSKYLFYNDPLLGVFDTQVRENEEEILANHLNVLKSQDFSNSQFKYLFETAIALLEFLQKKCTLGIKIKKSYLENNRKEIKTVVDRVIPKLINLLDKFYDLFKSQWQMENHSVGFEITDIRIGGVKERLHQTANILKKWLKGKVLNIAELEQARYPYSKNYENGQDILFNSYREIVSGSDI